MLTFLALLAPNLFAAQNGQDATLVWAKSYEEAFAKAKKENKLVMVMLTAQNCGWCKKMKTETLKSKEVIQKLSSSFVCVEIDRDADRYPEEFFYRMVPAYFFVNPANNAIVMKALGYSNEEAFLGWLEDAMRAAGIPGKESGR